MGLVDYSSSSSDAESVDDDDDDAQPPPAKRRKDAGHLASPKSSPKSGGPSEMPPLPPTFHDLYASTVRHSVVDDPALHQGRRRQTPHVAGNWPTHLYVEWHPTGDQHDELAELVREIAADLKDEAELHDLLTSDLGAPLPLHISLSRPLALPAADKDAFLSKITAAIRHPGAAPFTVNPRSLAWYRSPDSERAFLILRVTSASTANEAVAVAPNPELLPLLTRCNAVAERFGQPALYQQSPADPVGAAFHVSVGWAFAMPDEGASLRALRLLGRARFRGVREWRIGVGAVKVKIGNVVHHVPLEAMGEGAAADGPGGLV